MFIKSSSKGKTKNFNLFEIFKKKKMTLKNYDMIQDTDKRGATAYVNRNLTVDEPDDLFDKSQSLILNKRSNSFLKSNKK